MSKGLLLLDIDGVLNPYATNDADAATRGYETLPGSTAWLQEHLFNKRAKVRGRTSDGPMLVALAEECDLELVWATMWNDDANRILAPEIGLPELPVIAMDHYDPEFQIAWKFGPINRYAEGRPLAWLDDDMGVHVNARVTFEGTRSRAEASTLLVDVLPHIGITDEHTERVREWARGLA